MKVLFYVDKNGTVQGLAGNIENTLSNLKDCKKSYMLIISKSIDINKNYNKAVEYFNTLEERVYER